MKTCKTRPMRPDWNLIKVVLSEIDSERVRKKTAKILMYDSDYPVPLWLRMIADDYDEGVIDVESESVRRELIKCGYNDRFASKRSVFNDRGYVHKTARKTGARVRTKVNVLI